MNEDSDELSAIESTKKAAAARDAFDAKRKEWAKSPFPKSLTVVKNIGTGVYTIGEAHIHGQYEATYVLKSVKRLQITQKLEDV